MNEKLQQAKQRINEMGFTQAEQDFIFADWSNMAEHLDWLLTASREEIVSWIKASAQPTNHNTPAGRVKGRREEIEMTEENDYNNGEEKHVCSECGAEFTTWYDDTSESGKTFGHPEMCWTCGSEAAE